MSTINLKDPPNLSSDEALYPTDADLREGDLHRELVDSIAGVSLAVRSRGRKAPTPMQGFATTGGWGLW